SESPKPTTTLLPQRALVTPLRLCPPKMASTAPETGTAPLHCAEARPANASAPPQTTTNANNTLINIALSFLVAGKRNETAEGLGVRFRCRKPLIRVRS